MKWNDVRNTCSNQWVIIEAVRVHSDGEQRIIDDLSIVEVFGNDSSNGMYKYKEIHRDNKQRELYVVHTSREELDIKERTWIGVRDR